jgi:hypothetical protein
LFAAASASTAPPNTRSPSPALLSRVTLAPRVTGSRKCCAPLVVIAAPFRWVPPGASVVRLVRAWPPPPTAPPKVVVPAVFTVRANGPASVLAKVMSPDAVEVRVASAVRVTGAP